MASILQTFRTCLALGIYLDFPFKLLISLELKSCLDATETVFCHISHRLWLWRGEVPMFIPCI